MKFREAERWVCDPSVNRSKFIEELIVWAESPSGCGIEKLASELDILLQSCNKNKDEQTQSSPCKTVQPINTHSTQEIKAYVQEQLNVPSVKNHQLRFAAWKWLRPGCRLDGLNGIQGDVGYQGSPLEFVTALREACLDQLPDHPCLERWINRRLALLDYQLHLPSDISIPKNLMSMNYALFTRMFKAYRSFQSSIDEQELARAKETDTAQKILHEALDSAAKVVCQVLANRSSEDPLHFKANLMIAATPDFLHQSLFNSNKAKENIQIAEHLWQKCSSDARLVVVSEIGSSEDLGFWLPLNSSCPQGKKTPGATHAYYNNKASAVFAEDPPLSLGIDLSGASHSQWVDYLNNNLQHPLFISIPISAGSQDREEADNLRQQQTRSRQSHDSSQQLLAVLNVNIHPDDADNFYRAYHPEWLALAQQVASPFALEAFKAFQLLHSGIV